MGATRGPGHLPFGGAYPTRGTGGRLRVRRALSPGASFPGPPRCASAEHMAFAGIGAFLFGHADDALAAALGGVTGLELVASASSGREAIAAVTAARPAVILLDLDLRGGTVAALPALQAAAPDSRIVAITDAGDPVRHTAALYAGARGLVRKHQLAELLPRALPKILAGELWFERQLVASALLATLAAKRRLEEEGERRAFLAPRRRDMLALSGEGLSDDEIAGRLSLSPGIVRTQVAALTKKLGLATRLELVAYAHLSGAMTGARPAAPG